MLTMNEIIVEFKLKIRRVKTYSVKIDLLRLSNFFWCLILPIICNPSEVSKSIIKAIRQKELFSIKRFDNFNPLTWSEFYLIL